MGAGSRHRQGWARGCRASPWWPSGRRRGGGPQERDLERVGHEQGQTGHRRRGVPGQAVEGDRGTTRRNEEEPGHQHQPAAARVARHSRRSSPLRSRRASSTPSRAKSPASPRYQRRAARPGDRRRARRPVAVPSPRTLRRGPTTACRRSGWPTTGIQRGEREQGQRHRRGQEGQWSNRLQASWKQPGQACDEQHGEQRVGDAHGHDRRVEAVEDETRSWPRSRPVESPVPVAALRRVSGRMAWS